MLRLYIQYLYHTILVHDLHKHLNFGARLIGLAGKHVNDYLKDFKV